MDGISNIRQDVIAIKERSPIYDRYLEKFNLRRGLSKELSSSVIVIIWGSWAP